MKNTPSSRPTFFFAVSLALALGCAGSASTFADRSEWMLDSLHEQELREQPTVGRGDVAVAAARLSKDPADSEALEYIANVRSGGQPAFNMPMVANAYLRFHDHFSDNQKTRIAANAAAVLNWNEDYTENHRILLWSSLHLLAQSFPGATWNWEEDGEMLSLSSPAAITRTREKLLQYGQSLFEMGHNEFLSPNYEGFKIASWLNLRDFAEDAGVQAAAEAALLYHTTALAHASFEEVLMPPYSRGIGTPLSRQISADVQWTTWMLWGVGDRGAAHARPDLTHFFLALTDWRPEPVLDSIARGEIENPYTFLAEQPFFFSSERGYMKRTTYREPRFAVSSGVYRFDPEDLNIPGARQLIDDAQFMIVWESAHSHRQIMAGDPYWRSASGAGWGDTSSPFMQTGQHDNMAIVLFDIPPEDPWSELEQWSGTRLDRPLPYAQVRVPRAATLHSSESGWRFLEDGGIFIAIKVLQPGATLDRRGMMEIGYDVIMSRGVDGERWQTGFVFEVGTSDEFASLQAFQESIESNPLEVDWDAWLVSYTGSRGKTLSVDYNQSLTPPDLALPTVRLDGETVDFSVWPVMESPFVLLEDRVLRLHRGDDSLIVDWRSVVPATQTGLPRSPGGLLHAAARLDETWYTIDHLGDFTYEHFDTWSGRGWIFHRSEGWMYAHQHEGSDFFYSMDPEIGWLFTTGEALPYAFHFQSEDWIELNNERR